MKLSVLSDLHLSIWPFTPPSNDADVVILAGDIARPREAAAFARQFEKPVLYVLGNHEFYGGSLDGTKDEMARLCAGTNVHLLDCGERVLGGVRFLGATLWTDFRLFDDPARSASAKAEALLLVRDFSRIRLTAAGQALFAPDDSARLFADHAAWLRARLQAPHTGPTVVITHHAPTRASIHPRFADSLLNPCFVSDAADLLAGDRVQLWIHGHTHDSFDYVANGTRVVCNPRGYAQQGRNENAAFDPDLTIEVV